MWRDIFSPLSAGVLDLPGSNLETRILGPIERTAPAPDLVAADVGSKTRHVEARELHLDGSYLGVHFSGKVHLAVPQPLVDSEVETRAGFG